MSQKQVTSNKIDPILKKIDETAIPSVDKIAIAFSGGVDSSLSLMLAKHVYQAEEICVIIVDVGQGEDEVEHAVAVATSMGTEPILIQAKEQFSAQWLPLAIQANANYCSYPISTSMTSQLWSTGAAKINGLPLDVLAGRNALIDGKEVDHE